MTFEALFRTSSSSRDKFLARLFGLFSEDLVRLWCRNPKAPYEDLGRPNIHLPDSNRSVPRPTGNVLFFRIHGYGRNAHRVSPEHGSLSSADTSSRGRSGS